MEILKPQPTEKASGDTFTGDAWVDMIVRGEAPSRVRAAVVRFAPGARNAWHAHAVGQTVHVTDGVGWIQSRGGDVVEMRAGDTVVTPAGEWHWHGAAPDRFMTHLAIWEASATGGPETEWGELVSDAEYRVAPGRGESMSAWTPDELARIGHAEELEIASRREDGTLRPYVTIWTVRAGDEIFVRSAYGYDNGWFQHALRAGVGRIRAGGVERDAAFAAPEGSEAASRISDAYHAKYDRYGARMVATVVSRDAVRATLRVTPR